MKNPYSVTECYSYTKQFGDYQILLPLQSKKQRFIISANWLKIMHLVNTTKASSKVHVSNDNDDDSPVIFLATPSNFSPS